MAKDGTTPLDALREAGEVFGLASQDREQIEGFLGLPDGMLRAEATDGQEPHA